MTYLLDTNTCVRYLNKRSLAVINRLRNTPESEIALCSVVKAELYFGAMKSQNPEATIQGQRVFAERFISLPFDDSAAEFYAQIRADLATKGMPIGGNDLMIAAIALANGLILVTHNTREFSRVAGLQIEDWEAENS
jgi:tRNA(fMet)-specific endonuclease VapC